MPIEWSNDFDSSTVYDASTIGPACYQSLPQSLYQPINESFAYTPQGTSENCLTVDVLVPTHPVSKSLPVMVQIHGGGYTSGSAQSYPGDAMVNASDGKSDDISRCIGFEIDENTARKHDLRLNAVSTRPVWLPQRQPNRAEWSAECWTIGSKGRVGLGPA